MVQVAVGVAGCGISGGGQGDAARQAQQGGAESLAQVAQALDNDPTGEQVDQAGDVLAVGDGLAERLGKVLADQHRKVGVLGLGFIALVRVTETPPSDSGFAVFAGNATLDLSSLDERDSGRTIEVWMFAVNVDIELPEDHPTRVTVNLLAGNTIATSTDGETRTTRGPFQVYVTGANLTGAATTDITEVQVRMLAGNARIDGTESESEATR